MRQFYVMCHLQYWVVISFYIGSKDQTWEGDVSIISAANQSFLTLVEGRGDDRQNANLYCERSMKFPYLQDSCHV